MANALLLHPTLETPQMRPPTISADLFDLSLSEGAIAVYVFLSTSVRRMRINNLEQWICTAPTDRIADKCFRGGRPDAKAPSLRKRVASATHELLKKGLIAIGDRFDLDDRRGNYYILPSAQTEAGLEVIHSGSHNRQVHAMRSNSGDQVIHSGSHSDPKTGMRSEIGSPVIHSGSHEGLNDGMRSVSDHSNGGMRSTMDHLSLRDLDYINNIYNLDPERERESFLNSVLKDDPLRIKQNFAAKQNFATETAIENTGITAEYSIEADGAVVEAGAVMPDNPDEVSAEPDAGFDSASYDWRCYSAPGDGGSDPAFWDYTVGIVQTYSDQKPGRVDSVPAFALGCIRREGAKRYEVFVSKRRSIAVAAKQPVAAGELAFTPVEPQMPIDQAGALAREYWRDLKLSWEHPQVVAWLQAAIAWRSFEIQGVLNLHSLPNWALCRLVEDMALAVKSKITSGVGL